MKLENIFTKESTVKINVITLENRKLTKSLLEQIDYKFPFSRKYELICDKIFGYVKISNSDNSKGFIRIVIGEMNGKLFKFPTSRLEQLCSIGQYDKVILSQNILDINTILEYPENFINDTQYLTDGKINYNEIGEVTYNDLFNDEGLAKIFGTILDVNEFLEELGEHQVYI
ncbi:hypothetical protein M2T70_12965 [Elizabethkingia anophelis]|uniref:hypothetical protein n=1 Tax=Elizabethkingia anophelis TaxID=1117645 RepID=UPI000995B4A7|nr:hypothetical protein [Elizabethkingia anophelis]AQW97447.1 hypothetical protein BBD31_05885 [Elizabethkingia anophelis]ASV77226.1 hypothetical protein A6J37_00645 [Elizabethkingia anophelis]MCL1649865.1 hypothetical protein [Elizabethkingia anophelis]MCL1681214.1 hypothetical protein [Elizabethkingia anophelis]MDV3552712.1 hypothetical protein [Elizabethkingia anophelis]